VEVLNTDASLYGGSDTGNASAPQVVQALPSHGRSASLVLTLPPLATLFLRPAA
jgi:1,4-alpha-glucan branching enzyme